MNYTINEIPDTAEEANNTDYAIMWQDKTKKISISNLFNKLVKKSEVTNTISAINENPITSKAVSSLLTISASTTTITDAPPLQNGITLRIFFTSEIAGTDNTTVLQITYNGTSYNVKVPKDGALQNYVAFEVSSGVFKYLQAYTTLELLFDGTQFVIIGNPVVLSGSNYLYYADGSHNTNTVASGNIQSVTSDGVSNALNSYTKRLQDAFLESNQSISFNTLSTHPVIIYVNNNDARAIFYINEWGNEVRTSTVFNSSPSSFDPIAINYSNYVATITNKLGSSIRVVVQLP